VENNQDAGDIKGLVLENTFRSIRSLIPRQVDDISGVEQY
jgi:hypothetical protein